jgi:hypothetical protein
MGEPPGMAVTSHLSLLITAVLEAWPIFSEFIS